MTKEWPRISYRDFYDIPRAFVARWKGSSYFFDCPYDENLGDYGPRFAVSRLPSSVVGRLEDTSWSDLGSLGEAVGFVEAARLQFDPTRRHSISPDVFAELGL